MLVQISTVSFHSDVLLFRFMERKSTRCVVNVNIFLSEMPY